MEGRNKRKRSESKVEANWMKDEREVETEESQIGMDDKREGGRENRKRRERRTRSEA